MNDFFGIDIPFLRLCGIKAISKEKGKTRLGVIVGPQHDNSAGIAHGGLTLTLLDVAMGSAARSTLEGDWRVLTISLQTHFLEPARGELVAEGRVVRAGRSLIYCEADVHTGDGLLVARASGMFKPVRADKFTKDAAK